MKELFGGPGKKSGLVIRIGQCMCAAGSIGILASASGFSTTTAFWKHIPLIKTIAKVPLDHRGFQHRTGSY